MNQRSQYKTWTFKQLQENIQKTLEDIGIGTDFLNRSQEVTNGIASNKKASAYQMKQLPEWRETQRMGENLCQLFIWHKINTQNIEGTETLNKY
jgi:hypothetical protein